MSFKRHSANMLNRFWVGMLALVSIPVLVILVGPVFYGEGDLFLIVIGQSTYSMAF